MTDIPTLSVIVPALDAAPLLAGTLAALAPARPMEIIVVDGGSADRTCEIVEAAGARVLSAPRGRGGQLAAGAAAATGDWLLFLHADTKLAPGWEHAASAYMARTAGQRRAAAFRHALDHRARAARRIERLVAWRTRVLGLPYGDQGLLIPRAFYDEVGGFRPLPLMEDVDIVRRIGRRRIDRLDAAAVTSADRYRRGGWWLRPLRNLFCLTLYFAGVPPRLIERIYR